jgi:hypothetical protein
VEGRVDQPTCAAPLSAGRVRVQAANYTLPLGTPLRAATLGTSYGAAIRPRSTSGNPAAHPQPESRRQLHGRLRRSSVPDYCGREFV